MAKKEKALQKKLQVELGAVNLGKKDTAKIGCTAKFEDSGLDANAAQALLAGGQLHCRLDRGVPSQQTLPLDPKSLPPSTVEFDGTCHRIGMDRTAFSFGLSFSKTAAEANTLAEFAGQTARLTVTRTGNLADVSEDDSEGGDEE